MTRILLVRHGQAAAGWGEAADPGLDPIGLAQSVSLAARLTALGPLPVLTSPMQRCRETAQPLADAWQSTPWVEPAVSEIPTPCTIAVGQRGRWLRQAMEGTWSDLGPELIAYRDRVVATVLAVPVDAVAFSHFIAINAVIGAATVDDRLVVRRLDNASVTTIDVRDGRLLLVGAGCARPTHVN